MHRVTFDLDVLRSFIAGMDLGSFAKAADRLGRSTSAVSAQLKKLEEQAATPIFRKAGRGLALTEAGETMLAYARRLIDLNDEAVAAIGGADLSGWMRFGVQEDLGEVLLPEILGRFARAHPKARIEARVARNADLLERVASAQLDLAVAWGDEKTSAGGENLGEMPMRWIGPAAGERTWRTQQDDPLPLVMFDAPCLFRTAAIDALDRAGIAWRIAFTSASLAGLWAAVAAGLGVTLRTQIGLPDTVTALGKDEALPGGLPSLSLVLHHANAKTSPVGEKLAEIIRDSLNGPITRRKVA